MQTYEGEFLIAAHDFEKIEANFEKLLKQKKTTYFAANKVARLIINQEFRHTANYT